MTAFQRPVRRMQHRNRVIIFAATFALLLYGLRHGLLHAAGAPAQLPQVSSITAAAGSSLAATSDVAHRRDTKLLTSAESQAAVAASGVPRIIHHMHANLSALTPTQARLRERCQQLHPDFEFKFWSDDLLQEFIVTRFPDYYPTWASIEPRIKQLDSARYMLMHNHGGIYLDADVECVRSFNSLIEVLPPDAAWVGDWPEPMFLMSAPGNQLWLHVLERIARVWKELDAWHSTGPVGLGTAIREYVQKHGTGVLVPFLTMDARPEFQEFIKHKNDTVPWYELANGNYRLPEGSTLKPWYSPSQFPGDAAAANLPELPVSEGELGPHTSVGFIANELLDPPGCDAGKLSHCVESFCNETWPLAIVVHHCMNTWRGRIGVT